jgi:hypothetical protein
MESPSGRIRTPSETSLAGVVQSAVASADGVPDGAGAATAGRSPVSSGAQAAVPAAIDSAAAAAMVRRNGRELMPFAIVCGR